MPKRFSRFVSLIGEDKFNKLKNSNVIVFGVGGVGGHVIDALSRCGIERITIVDSDKVEESNINRQMVATSSTIGKSKVQIMKEHILDINPNCAVTAIEKLYLPSNEEEFDLSSYDYIIDAIDNVSAKLSLVERATKMNTPIISALGAGNKLDPTKLRVGDIYETSVDPLAKIMRHELRKRNIKKLKVVYSIEEPIKVRLNEEKRGTPGSSSFVPSSMGLIIASEVIKDLIK